MDTRVVVISRIRVVISKYYASKLTVRCLDQWWQIVCVNMITVSDVVVVSFPISPLSCIITLVVMSKSCDAISREKSLFLTKNDVARRSHKCMVDKMYLEKWRVVMWVWPLNNVCFYISWFIRPIRKRFISPTDRK